MNTKKLLLTFFLIGLSRVLFAQSLSAQASTSDTSASLATVYFYQSTPSTWIHVKYWVYANDKPVCKLNRNSHCRVTVPAGSVTFTTKIAFPSFGPKPSLTLNLEAGKTYYLQGDEKLALWPPQSILALIEVAPNPSKVKQIEESKSQEPLAGR